MAPFGGWASLAIAVAIAAVSPQTAKPSGWIETWRQQNDRGNRFEGVNFGKVVAVDTVLEVIGSEALPRDGSTLDTARSLVLRFHLPDHADAKLEARERMQRAYYRMEARPPEKGWRQGSLNVFAPWPTQTVLARHEIRPTDLVVRAPLARLSPEFEHYSAVAMDSGRAQPVTGVALVLLPKRHFASVSYEQAASCSSDATTITTSTGRQFAGVPFVIEAPVQKSQRQWLIRLVARTGSKDDDYARSYCVHLGG